MSSTTIRGADIVMRTLERAGHRTIFTLSGNHIMSLFDAAIDTRQRLVHTRHEAAAVHMADAWGRLTGEPGIAMVTGGPGHANAAAALMTAQGQESPLVLLSGHTETTQLGRGGFQELRQAEWPRRWRRRRGPRRRWRHWAPMWRRRSASRVRAGPDRCISACRRICSMRRSPPTTSCGRTPRHSPHPPVALNDAAADAILGIVATAQRPFLLAGPAMANRTGRDLLARIEASDADADRDHGKPARLQRRHARRVRRCDPARRPDRAAGQGFRLHAEVRRAAVGRCRLPLGRHRSRGGAGRSRHPRKGRARRIRLRRRHASRGRGADPPRRRTSTARGSPKCARC